MVKPTIMCSGREYLLQRSENRLLVSQSISTPTDAREAWCSGIVPKLPPWTTSARACHAQHLLQASTIIVGRKHLKQEVPSFKQTDITCALTQHIELLLTKLGFQ